MKTNTQYFLAGLSIGLIILGGIFTFFQPTPKILPEDKMKECRNAGGEYSVNDFSLSDDGSDYRMTCKIPEKKLWQFNY
jgi:hypothetical protein